jgi:hypothetical protein
MHGKLQQWVHCQAWAWQQVSGILIESEHNAPGADLHSVSK